MQRSPPHLPAPTVPAPSGTRITSPSTYPSTTLSQSPANSTVEIRPGVTMPRINLGGVASKPSNYTLWLQLGGRGLDTALMYGDAVQTEVGAAIKWGKATGIPREEIFLTTKIPCCPMHPNATFTDWCQTNPSRWNATANIEHDYTTIGVERVDLLLLHWPCATFFASWCFPLVAVSCCSSVAYNFLVLSLFQ